MVPAGGAGVRKVENMRLLSGWVSCGRAHRAARDRAATGEPGGRPGRSCVRFGGRPSERVALRAGAERHRRAGTVRATRPHRAGAACQDPGRGTGGEPQRAPYGPGARQTSRVGEPFAGGPA
ncbi:hypothetical protein GCM10023082_01900 [Streptomyces tremellae]|uniref:Uncharacterized protein n=1 Tax=Streptomyces tremellae TaxID=1124239 RepID=A0ABP7DQ03_9ACTN